MHQCSLFDLLTSEGLKLHPQILSTLPFSELASCEDSCSLFLKNGYYLTLFLFPVPFPHNPHTSDHSASLSHKSYKICFFISQIPKFGEAGLRLTLSLLGCLASKCIICCRACHVGGLVCYKWTNQPNLVTRLSSLW